MISKTSYIFLKRWGGVILPIFFILWSEHLHGQHLTDKFTLTNFQQGFVENKGQVADQDGRLRPDVKYIYSAPGFQLILKENSFSYQFYTYESKEPIAEASNTTLTNDDRGDKMPEPSTLKIHRVDITIKGANKHPTLVPEDKSSDYSNYYLAHTPEEGVTEVYAYNKITYKNIYPNIDFVFYAVEGKKLKYDIVVHPGGKLKDVKICYKGMNGLALQNDKVVLVTSLRQMTEEIPLSYIKETNEIVKAGYSLEGNTVSFIAPQVEDKTLVIDPILDWATYYGGKDLDINQGGIETDKEGNVYSCGGTSSSNNIATNGAFQLSLSGSRDAYLAKFSRDGVRNWGTYFGGNNLSQAYTLAIDIYSRLYITGQTTNDKNFSTNGVHQEEYGGKNDAFIARFDTSGLRRWCTYYGGDNQDEGRGIKTDGLGNIYMVGETGSTSAISTPGAHQENKNGYFRDVFVVKMDSSGRRVHGTYFGGEDSEEGLSIAVDSKGAFCITGYTFSQGNIATAGAHQASFAGGNDDVFIAFFDTSCSLQWSTYYGGAQSEVGWGVIFDRERNIYITGFSNSALGIATPGAWKEYPSGTDAFISKFNDAGVLQWGTYYGGSEGETADDLKIDIIGNIVIAGHTMSSDRIATARAYQEILGGGADYFLAKFHSNGSQLWGTYFGGESNERGGGGLALNSYGDIFLSGYTESFGGIATAGSHQPVRGGDLDAFIAKFNDKSMPLDVGLPAPAGHVLYNCDSMKAEVWVTNFSDSLAVDNFYVGYMVNDVPQPPVKWNGSLQPEDSLKLTLNIKPLKSGPNKVKAWTYNPNGGDDVNKKNDTLEFSFYLQCEDAGVVSGASTPLYTCDTELNTVLVVRNFSSAMALGSFRLHWSVNGGPPDSLQWTTQVKASDSVLVPIGKIKLNPGNNIILAWTSSPNGQKDVDKSNDTFTFIIEMYPPQPMPEIEGEFTACPGAEASYHSAFTPGSQYLWEAHGGDIRGSTEEESVSVRWDKDAQQHRISLTATNSQGCLIIAIQNVHVIKLPVLDIGPDQYICEEDSNLVLLDAGKGYMRYKWHPTGDTTHAIIVRKEGDYFVTVDDRCGSYEDGVKIRSYCPAPLYMPNAFTPNRDGHNEVFKPIATEVLEYSLIIYNRWGQKIFSTNEIEQGWDGTLKGADVPEGPYLWLLDYRIQEKEAARRYFKSGTVEVMR